MLTLLNHDENGVTIELPAKIDIANYEAFGEELNALRSEHPGGRVTLDLKSLGYISSSGIRILVELVKNESERVTMIHVNPDINEIFEDVGITSLMDIHSA